MVEEVAGMRDICQAVLTAIFPSGVLQQLFACLTQITTAGHSVLKFRKIVSCGGITNILLIELCKPLLAAGTARRQREHQIRWWRLGQQLYNGGSMEAHPGMARTTDTSPCHVLA